MYRRALSLLLLSSDSWCANSRYIMSPLVHAKITPMNVVVHPLIEYKYLIYMHYLRLRDRNVCQLGASSLLTVATHAPRKPIASVPT